MTAKVAVSHNRSGGTRLRRCRDIGFECISYGLIECFLGSCFDVAEKFLELG